MWAQWTLPQYFDPKHKIATLQKSEKSFIKKVRHIVNFHVGSRGRLCENMSIQFNIQRVTTIAFKRSETLQSCLKMYMLSPEVVFVKTCIFFVFFCHKIQLATYQRSDGCKNGRIIPRLWLWWCMWHLGTESNQRYVWVALVRFPDWLPKWVGSTAWALEG